MNGTYVTDITHYLDDEGELPEEMPGPARKLASFLVLVIDAVSDHVGDVQTIPLLRNYNHVGSRKDEKTRCALLTCGAHGTVPRDGHSPTMHGTVPRDGHSPTMFWL